MFHKFLIAVFVLSSLLRAEFPQEQATLHRSALPSSDVRGVALTASGAVFAGTAAGLVKLEGSRWRLTRPEPVELLAVRGEQVLAVAGRDLIMLGNEAVELRVPIPAETPRTLAACADVWLGADRLFRLAGSSFEAEPGAPPAIQGVACDAQGRVAVASRNGLFLGRRGGPWTPLYPEDGSRSWAPKDVRAVSFDTRGRLWFASPQGAGVEESGKWTLFTGEEGLPYNDFTSIAIDRDTVWFGTRIGAIRKEGSEWRYRQGRRWLPDDQVRAIAATPGSVWFATSQGLAQIDTRPMTYARKAQFFEEEIDKRHRRTPYGYVLEVRVPRPGDASEWRQGDSDNDGLWTAMYGAGACFACAATKDPRMCERARAAFEALRFLGTVTQGGPHSAPPGFVARSILPTDGRDPNLTYTAERDEERKRTRDNLWKVMQPRWPKSADGKWYWKSDTSSDELDGHYFFYGLYYDLVARDESERHRVREHVDALTMHLVKHGYRLIDHDGKVTRWGVFDPQTLNHSKVWWEERGLNSLSMLTYLRVAAHITGKSAYDDEIRRLCRQHSYHQNLMHPKSQTGPGTGNQSDDEMAFMNYYHLMKYEKDPDLRERVALSLARYWELERRERNPLFNFIAVASLRGVKFDDTFGTMDLTPPGIEWLDDSLDSLRRIPLDRFNWGYKNSHRIDIQRLRTDDEDTRGGGSRLDGKVLPYDEQFVMHWNHNPWALDYNGKGDVLADGAAYLLPYYMGLYHGFVKE